MKSQKKIQKGTEKKQRKSRTPSRSPINFTRPSGLEVFQSRQQGVSSLSNNTPDNFTGSLANIQSLPLYKYHKQYLNLKNKIIRTLVFCFYGIEQFAFMNYICYVIEEKYKNQIGPLMATEKYKNHEQRVETDMQELLVVRRDDLIAKFLDAEKIIQAIKQAKIIMDKQRDINYIKINGNFFHMLSSICNDILLKTSEQQTKQTKQEQKVTCKGCGTRRNYYQIQAKVKCNCGSIEMVVLKDSSEQKLAAKVLNTQILKVKNWKQQMDELKRKQIQRVTQERNKNFQSNRVTDVDRDIAKANQMIQKHGINFVSPWQRFPIKKNGVHLKMAEEEFAPKRQYKMIQQLGQVRKRRKTQKTQKIYL